MTCGEFFVLAVDPDEKPTPAQQQEIEKHRAECAECRQIEIDHRFLFGPPVLAEEVPFAPEGFEERIRARREARSKEGSADARPRIPKSWRPWSLLAAFLVGCLLATTVTSQLSGRPEMAPEGKSSLQIIHGTKPEQMKQDEKAAAPAFEGQKLPPPGDMLSPPGSEKSRGSKPEIPPGLENQLIKSLAKSLAQDLLVRCQRIEKGQGSVVEAHLGAADCLGFLGRKDEARAEAQAVLDDPSATEEQKKEARQLMPGN